MTKQLFKAKNYSLEQKMPPLPPPKGISRLQRVCRLMLIR